jgi:hypothetical protein
MNLHSCLMSARSREMTPWGRLRGTTLATLPADLRQWVNEPTLIGWILEEVSEAIFALPLRPAMGEGCAPVATMLTVLTYCYATGRYASEEIEAVATSDGSVRYLCANHFVTSATIRRFRRAHRESLRSCLLRLHRRAWQHRFGTRPGLSRSAEPPQLEPSQEDAITYRLAAATEAKIQQAILADTMALDV